MSDSCTNEVNPLNATTLYGCSDGDGDSDVVACTGGIVVIGLVALLYLGTTIYLLTSGYNYLVKQKKWKILIPFTFYLFSLAIVALRLF